MAVPAANKPPRVHPNFQGILGIRCHCEVGTAGRQLKHGVALAIGTIPANSCITAANASCSTAFSGATPTLDVGLRTVSGGIADPDGLIAGFDVSVPGIVAGAGAQLGYVADDSEVIVTLNVATDPTAGKADVVVQYYPNKD